MVRAEPRRPAAACIVARIAGVAGGGPRRGAHRHGGLITGKTVLITGGTGFVGANLARRLLSEGHQVHLLVRPGCATWRIRSVEGDLRLVMADLRDGPAVHDVLRSVRPEWIFHLAAYGAYPFQTELRRIAETNVAGAANLVDAALRVGFEGLVNAGSSSEYGYQSSAPPEDRPPEPNSAYAWSKVAATQLWQMTGRARGAHMPTLRLYSVFGPWEEPTRLVPTLIAHGLRGALPTLADPAVARDFVYVDDVAGALIEAARRPGADPGAVYNVGTGVQSTLADVVELARGVLGVDEEPRWGSMANRSWDTTVWVCNPSKIQAELGWRPRHSLASGFRAFVDWYRAHPDVAAVYDPPKAELASPQPAGR